MNRILCIAGSPRRGGNTDRLLDSLSAGVTEAGGEPTRLVVAELAIEPCRACHACSRTGECVVRDDMDDVYRAIDVAHAVVVATPVFFATVPAGLKSLYDRCQPYWARRYVLGAPPPTRKRSGAAIVVGGGGDPFGAQCAFTPTQSVFAVLGFSLDHRLEVTGVDQPADIESHPDSLEQARLIGHELAKR